MHFNTTSSFGEHSDVSTFELPLRNPLSLFRRYFYFILLFFLHNCGFPRLCSVLTSENVFEEARIKTNKASTASRRAQVRKIAYPATLSLLLVSSLKCGKIELKRVWKSSNSCSKPVAQQYRIYSIKRRNSEHFSVLHYIYK